MLNKKEASVIADEHRTAINQLMAKAKSGMVTYTKSWTVFKILNSCPNK